MDMAVAMALAAKSPAGFPFSRLRREPGPGMTHR